MLDTLVQLLGRSSFSVDEVEIFKAVLKWREVNEDRDNLAIKSVRLSQMTAKEIVSVVRPSKLFSDEVLLTAVTEILDVKPKTTAPRGKLLVDVNIATPKYKAEVLHGLHRPDVLLTGNRNTDLWISHEICHKNHISIKLEQSYIINHIHMRLYDQDTRYYRYYVEVSNDQGIWKKIIDYTNYPCISDQYLYFEPEKVQYIRVVGTHNTLNTQFHLIFFEAYYSSNPPVVTNQIASPRTNIAARVIQGSNPSVLLNNADGKKGYAYHVVNSESIIIQFGQPYFISTMRMRLWDQDNRFYRYFVETSTDKVKWEMAVDRRNENCKSWQNLSFKERVVVFVRITGTHNSANNIFHLFHFEAPSSDQPGLAGVEPK